MVVEILIDFFGYYTAKAILPIVSFGHIRVANVISEKPGGWFGYYRDDHGRLVFAQGMARCIGILIWLLALLIAILTTGR